MHTHKQVTLLKWKCKPLPCWADVLSQTKPNQASTCTWKNAIRFQINYKLLKWGEFKNTSNMGPWLELHRNEVLLTAYSDTFLLPHLKDLSSQHVFVSNLCFFHLKKMPALIYPPQQLCIFITLLMLWKHNDNVVFLSHPISFSSSTCNSFT